jgi:hypothetical protein
VCWYLVSQSPRYQPSLQLRRHTRVNPVHMFACSPVRFPAPVTHQFPGLLPYVIWQQPSTALQYRKEQTYPQKQERTVRNDKEILNFPFTQHLQERTHGNCEAISGRNRGMQRAGSWVQLTVTQLLRKHVPRTPVCIRCNHRKTFSLYKWSSNNFLGLWLDPGCRLCPFADSSISSTPRSRRSSKPRTPILCLLYT